MKISKNPQKGFLKSPCIVGWTKLKNDYIFELYITQAFFCPRSWNFTTTRSRDFRLVGHPNVQHQPPAKIFHERPRVCNDYNSLRSLRIKTTINSYYDREYFIYTGFSTRHRESVLNPGVRRNSSYAYCICIGIGIGKGKFCKEYLPLQNFKKNVIYVRKLSLSSHITIYQTRVVIETTSAV